MSELVSKLQWHVPCYCLYVHTTVFHCSLRTLTLLYWLGH